MTGWFNPDNWLDLVSQLLLMAGAIALAIIPTWLSTRRGLKRVTDQVENGHAGGPALRADVDAIRDSLSEIKSDLHQIKSDVTDIRAELRTERKDRLDLDDRFERFKRTQ